LQNPSAITDAVNAFLGFESEEDTFGVPGVSGDARFIADVEKRDAVVEAFKVCLVQHGCRCHFFDSFSLPLACMESIRCVHSISYQHFNGHITERDAMGSDEYHPVSQNGSNLTEAGGIGYTVIDSIDSMLVMGLDEDYKKARQWIETKLDFDRDAEFSTFEVCSSFHLRT